MTATRALTVPMLVTAASIVAACSSSGGSETAVPDPSGPAASPPATVATSTTGVPSTAAPSTAAPSTAAPATVAPTSAPARPEPVTVERLVVAGPEEVVFDWTTDRCEDEHIPDIAARAFRDSSGLVHVTIGHYVTYRMSGPDLDQLSSDCSAPILRSDHDPDPAAFNDSEWIGSPFTIDGETVYAVVHNEYRGDTHRDVRPGQCPSGARLPCLDTSFTMAVSTDGGATFSDIRAAPDHLIATLPYPYDDDGVPSGIRQPSNVIEGPDGYWYLFGNVSDQPDERQWVCAMRTDDLADPSAWRYWDGTGFTGEWTDPYREPVDGSEKCAPLEDATLAGSVQESVVFDERLDRYVMVGISTRYESADPTWGVYYSLSEDLVDWTQRELLLEVPVNATVADPANDLTHAYPAIIDPDSPSPSFSTSDGSMYLYLSRFNSGGNSLDRDLLRWPIEVSEEVAVAPDWAFDSDADPEGWFADNHLTPLDVADGMLTTQSTGEDPWMLSGPVAIPAGYDQLLIRMRVPDGVDETGQLFYVTDAEPDWGGRKVIDFDVVGDGEFRDVVLDLSDAPGWTGTIRALRIDPVESTDRTIEIDRIAFLIAGSD